MSKPYKPREITLSRLCVYIDGLLSSDYNQKTDSLLKLRLILEEDLTVINKQLLNDCVKEAAAIYSLVRQDKNEKDEPRDEVKHDVSMIASSTYTICINWESRCR